jgi:hypothetical protein
VGISIFLLTVMFVFAFVPSVLQPSAVGEETTLTAEADRVASGAMSNLSIPAKPNKLNKTKTDKFFGHFKKNNASVFREQYGLPSHVEINVTIRRMDETATLANATGPYAFGDEYRTQQAVVVKRVITMDHHNKCQTGCLLIVRIW